MILTALFRLVGPVCILGLLAPLVIFLLWLTKGHSEVQTGLSCLAAFTLGHSFNMLDAYDLCLELGPAWKVLEPDQLFIDSRGWRALRGFGPSHCTPPRLADLQTTWLERCRVTRASRMALFAWLASPAVYFLANTYRMYGLPGLLA
jgi:hypothetical protein